MIGHIFRPRTNAASPKGRLERFVTSSELRERRGLDSRFEFVFVHEVLSARETALPLGARPFHTWSSISKFALGWGSV
jgi:hypothetical protein